MRWLLLKDLRILRRSPLLVALLVALSGRDRAADRLALTRGPDKPKVAFVNEVPARRARSSSAASKLDLADRSGELFEDVDPVEVDSRAEAIEKVRDGEVLAR